MIIYSGIHLKDIISIHTAHLDKLENELINFRKMAQLSVIFQSVTDLQNSVPPFQENRDLIKLLQVKIYCLNIKTPKKLIQNYTCQKLSIQIVSVVFVII